MKKLEVGELARISLCVNGAQHTVSVEPRTTLGDCLRNDLGLTGTHLGCEHGVCGACTVHVDGATARSCLMLAAQAQRYEIHTVESLACNGELNDLQQAFRELHGLQCGFCTPGILMTLTELLRDMPEATEEDVRLALSGHICRCTGYQNIVAAAMRTLESRRTVHERA
ncbi:(2Fe-2S)-binding protein [Pigmentiphaga sp.]|uniref:(2Fe-2S)-binding protein n=1 Tax=Pigmentiphaga sp. TaxID=1977564 RepID=UPI00128C1B85|nr:(2Fe-2S)-binding protein [Pigmentiphaga sp.]MPS28243.1 (2Fe-2S)-binding protein [Alcaligenaceae bacterium SAGV5]MPS28352.1 (2Fe-2S)-binding protein [Alcaligenaceae bacterium SAGV5]MPS51441.1 (2Fe-2S)-binding protein [Alcaligenaceae bacterium SAGV3]MPT56009.1 (2Fe-2S)-binding protein [Alcaligenaceae bacterium]